MEEHKEKYQSFLEQLIRITHKEPYDREAYVKLITEICEYYGLSKGVTEFYRNPMLERRHEGEIFCDFDNGRTGKVIVHIRFMTISKAIIIGTIYANAGEPDKSDEEILELETMMRVILGFVSRMRLIRKLEEFGYSDIAGYPNFRAFVRYLQIKNLENRLGGKIAVQIDIHNFTTVNQEIGRQNADLVLRNYYTMLKDAIGDTGILVRLGGDKFVGIFDRRVKRDVFNILSGVPVPCDVNGNKRVRISAATGVYMLPDPFMMKTHGDIMDKIIMAGNTAKREVDGAIVIYDDKMRGETDRIKRVQLDFRDALEKEDFLVYYQPKVNIETGEIVGAEALCRWQRNGKIVPPLEFIPILEMGMDICDLDFYMLNRVCRHIRKWLDQGRDVPRVSVNFSRKHLVDVDLMEHIMAIIDENEVPHELIEIELTETTTDVLFRDLKKLVCGLQEKGIKTAVDDFGIGYSSLNLIRDIPWNVLKVDKSFVPRTVESDGNVMNLMFRHVISLAQDIGMECVIEGVETLDQLDVLRENHCYIAQGYFFDRPLPLEEYEERLDRGVYPVSS